MFPQYKVHSRNPRNNIVAGDGQRVIQPFFGVVAAQKPECSRRIGHYQDYINCRRLVQTSKVVQSVSSLPQLAADPEFLLMSELTRPCWTMSNGLKSEEAIFFIEEVDHDHP